MSLPLGPGRDDCGPAVVWVRTAKSAVAGDDLLHAHFVGWQSAIGPLRSCPKADITAGLSKSPLYERKEAMSMGGCDAPGRDLCI